MKQKTNPILLLAMVLLCLVMITTHMTAGLYARYTASGSGEDSARVAKFDVTESGTLIETMVLSVIPGKEYLVGSIEVVNSSEVSVAYTITVEKATDNLPIKLYFEGVTPATEITYTGTLAPNNSESTTYNLYSSWTENKSTEYMGRVDKLEITLKAEQID